MRHGEHQPYVSVEHLSRRYEPIRVRRIEHIFALLGGIVPGEGASFEDEEEDLIDEEEDEERVAPGRVALDDVSFDVVGGSCLALVGPARAGKSVLMRTIAGLAPPTSGRVAVRGRVAAALDSSVRLFPRAGKLRSGLPIFAGLHGISPRIVRKRFQEIADFLEWPDMGKQYVSLLSTKQRKRLMLGLVLNVDADIVLIDLSPAFVTQSSAALQERMLKLKGDGKLLIVTGPNVESVSWIADRVLHLKRGAIVDDERIVPTNRPPSLPQHVNEDEDELLESQLVPAPGEL